MDILLFLFLAVFLWKAEYKKNGINNDYLSPASCLSWKGVLAIAVIYHHLALQTDSSGLFSLFGYVGYPAVAVFFFFSGYGLHKKHISDDNYKKNFIQKRIPKILFPYLIITAIYWIVYAFDGTIFSLWGILSGIIRIDPIAKYSWYIVVVLIFYLVFFLLMKFFKKNYNHMILGATLFCILWTIVCLAAGIKYERYITVPLLVIGMVWATYEQKLLYHIKKHYLCLLIATISGFAIFFLAPYTEVPLNHFYYIKDFMKTLSALFFTLVVLLISLKWRIGNPLTDFIGRLSLESYLLHGLFVYLFRSNILKIQSNLSYSLLVLLSSILFSYAFNKLCKILFSKSAH